MAVTVKLASKPEGVLVTIVTDKEAGKREDMIAQFGGGNLQTRLVFMAVKEAEFKVDNMELDINDRDAAALVRVGSWIENRSPIQEMLYAQARFHVSSKKLDVEGAKL